MTDLSALYVALAAIFGALIGSFLNVCIYRIPRDLSIVWPRSFCPECEHAIRWYDNIPLISYALRRGKCRDCNVHIPIRYPIVEALTAALFALVVIRYSFTLAAVKWAIFEAVLVVLFWTDLELRLLPDELTLGGTAVGLMMAFFVPVSGFLGLMLRTRDVHLESIINCVGGAVILAGTIWLIGWLYGRVRRVDALGLGDVKLLLLIGAFLGFEKGLSSLLIATVAGSIVGVGYVLVSGKKALHCKLPLGSFVAAAAAVLPVLERLT